MKLTEDGRITRVEERTKENPRLRLRLMPGEEDGLAGSNGS